MMFVHCVPHGILLSIAMNPFQYEKMVVYKRFKKKLSFPFVEMLFYSVSNIILIEILSKLMDSLSRLTAYTCS